ncbi:SMI1/KNR4 family protein [Streptomyces flavotricini]|uniref:SMI1/KNR4 family protein n=1 Tax=Streptomyces flavotricini TaxID=66888 RepID=A0ABS8E6P5_9ACTN|nr:SMI1/KNR4 family protein [Streptomyces flavotricini]MCC0096574.1 SMI1/KNR4 family protein [Streptomyces flavotricini]
MNGTEQLLERVAQHVSGFGPEVASLAPGRPPAPVDQAAVRRAEDVLGFALPPLLAGLYTRIADGGFGPEYGLLPPETAVKQYTAIRSSDWGWPEGVLPTTDYGCAVLGSVDCRSETAQVLLFEPNPGDPDLAWYTDSPTLADWPRGWLDGTAWFCDDAEDAGLEMGLWPEFRSRL